MRSSGLLRPKQSEGFGVRGTAIVSDDCGLTLVPHRCDQRPAPTSFLNANKERRKKINNYKGAVRFMKLLGLDHVGIVVRNVDEAVTRAGETVDGKAVGERFVDDNIDLQVVTAGDSTLELIEVRNPGFGMPKLGDRETAVIGHFGIEVDDLEDTKAELRRRGVVLQGEVETAEVHFIFTAPQTTFGVTLQLMQHKGRGTGA